ncbi:MAG: hypothetical protein ACTHJQ_27200 [Rhizobiaceae bacterium]
MRTVDTPTYDWLVNATDKGIRPRNIIYFKVRSFDGESTEDFVFWNELDPSTVTVIDGATGNTVNRNCVGDGALLSIDDIPLTSDLTIQTIKCSLSQIHETVEDMVRGYDVRLAKVQVHRALFDPQTNELVSFPLPHFMGTVDKATVGTPAAGNEGSIDFSLVSIIREMTRTNPAKKSDETQKRRSGDRFRKYNSTAGQTDVFWGLKKERADGGNGRSSTPSLLGMLGK